MTWQKAEAPGLDTRGSSDPRLRLNSSDSRPRPLILVVSRCSISAVVDNAHKEHTICKIASRVSSDAENFQDIKARKAYIYLSAVCLKNFFKFNLLISRLLVGNRFQVHCADSLNLYQRNSFLLRTSICLIKAEENASLYSNRT